MGIVDSITSWLSGAPELTQLIAALALLAFIIFAAAVLMKIFGPIGQGTGSAIQDIGKGAGVAIEEVGTGVGRLFGVRDLLLGIAAGIVQRAKNDEETIDVGVEWGDGRKFWVKGHGPGTAPVLAEKITDLPIAQISPPSSEVVGLLTSPAESRGHRRGRR